MPSWHIAMAQMFLLFGVASRRAGTPFRTLGHLLLAVSATLVVAFVLPRFLRTVVEVPNWIPFVVEGLLPALLVVIGYVVW